MNASIKMLVCLSVRLKPFMPMMNCRRKGHNAEWHRFLSEQWSKQVRNITEKIDPLPDA